MKIVQIKMKSKDNKCGVDSFYSFFFFSFFIRRSEKTPKQNMAVQQRNAFLKADLLIYYIVASTNENNSILTIKLAYILTIIRS